MADASAQAFNPYCQPCHISCAGFGPMGRFPASGAVLLTTTQVPQTTKLAKSRRRRSERRGTWALSVRNWLGQIGWWGQKLPALNEYLRERRKSLVLNGGPACPEKRHENELESATA
jgi:hypothetical protein